MTVTELDTTGLANTGTEDDYTTGENPNLAWDAMVRLVERLYPDYKD
jgi:hypothetical protein